MEREKTINVTREMAPYASEEEIGEYVLKRWTWYEKQVCTDRATKVLDQEKGLHDTSLAEFYLHMLNICLVKAPFDRSGDINENIKRLKRLDPDIGDRLQDVCRDLNQITGGEKAGF